MPKPYPQEFRDDVVRVARDHEPVGIGLRNVDERLRRIYGDGAGLVIEPAIGAGVKVTVRIPKRAR